MRWFVSATTAGFRSLRVLVASRLRALGHEAVLQEEFGGASGTVSHLIRTRMRDCDAVVALLGPAFGCRCPASDPSGPERSYTQVEYELATRVFDKPTFLLFFDGDPAAIDPFRQGDAEERAQRSFLEEVRAEAERATGRLYDRFANADQLLVRVDDFVRHMERRARPPAESDLRHLPTPLVLVWEEVRRCPHARVEPYRKAAGRILAFVAAVATQDAGGSTGRAPLATERAGDGGMWPSARRLLDRAAAGCREVPEIPGWLASGAGVLASVEASLARLAGDLGEEDPDAVCAAVRQSLGSLVASLGWTADYVLAGLRSEGGGKAATVRILRGGEPRFASLPLLPGAPAEEGERLFLLDLRRRRALGLWPALWCLPEENPMQPVAIADVVPESAGTSLRLRSLCPTGPAERRIAIGCAELPWDRLPAEWLASEELRDRAPPGERTIVSARPTPLLPPEGWDALDAAVRPGSERETLLAGRFRVSDEVMHKGARADLFAAVAEARAGAEDASPECCAAYLLPGRLLSDPQARSDLEARHLRWKALSHPAVLPPLPESDTGPGAARPFLLTPLRPDRQPLDAWLRRPPSGGGRALSSAEARRLLEIAAEVCDRAHRSGLRLLHLPSRHLLCDPDHPDDALLTGFETLFPASGGPESAWTFAQRCSRDAILAPELREAPDSIRPSADVFALGAFLLRIRPMPGLHAGMDTLPTQHRDDPWACLAFHCVAADPGARFQSPAHLLEFVRVALDRSPDSAPRRAPVPAGPAEVAGRSERARTFEIGIHPVTTVEYERFQRATGHRPPFREDAIRESGPWCPVTGVSLDDARAYCSWLERNFGGRWRLPSEVEWVRAATLGDARAYPWGDEPPGDARANHARRIGGPSVVGAFPEGVSASGCHDMAGNVWEWCDSFLAPGSPLRVVRGGAYDFEEEDLLLRSRRGVLRTHRSPHVGFRVIRETEPAANPRGTTP